MNRHGFIAVTLAASLAGLAGCNGAPPDGGKRAARAGSRSAGGRALDEGERADQALATKLGGYIECNNTISHDVESTADRYLSWADPRKGPSATQNNIYGLYEINDFRAKECLEAIAKANQHEPSLPKLEAAASAYAAALTKLKPLVKEAKDYYDQKNYQDDKMAKGLELHPKLMATFDEFEAANKAMRAEYGPADQAMKERTLARLEKSEGRKIPFLREDLMFVARALLKQGMVDDLSRLDLAAFTAKLGEYEKLVIELEAYVTAHPDEAARSRNVKDMVSKGKDYLTAAKELMRRVRDKVPFSDFDKHQLASGSYSVEGSPVRLLKVYNELVDLSNRRF